MVAANPKDTSASTESGQKVYYPIDFEERRALTSLMTGKPVHVDLFAKTPSQLGRARHGTDVIGMDTGGFVGITLC